jgi:hypothetical protein
VGAGTLAPGCAAAYDVFVDVEVEVGYALVSAGEVECVEPDCALMGAFVCNGMPDMFGRLVRVDDIVGNSISEAIRVYVCMMQNDSASEYGLDMEMPRTERYVGRCEG